MARTVLNLLPSLRPEDSDYAKIETYKCDHSGRNRRTWGGRACCRCSFRAVIEDSEAGVLRLDEPRHIRAARNQRRRGPADSIAYQRHGFDLVIGEIQAIVLPGDLEN